MATGRLQEPEIIGFHLFSLTSTRIVQCPRAFQIFESMSELTRILEAVGQGNVQASEELLPLVYKELRRLAAWRMAQEKPGHTLQPTALVHEAYLRLLQGDTPGWNGRKHFFNAAAEAMRRILIERARQKDRIKHGGGHP